jgi:hypothetical protein
MNLRTIADRAPATPVGSPVVTSEPLRLGLWGTFDVSNYGDALFPRIITAELKRRLPAAAFRTYSPCGWEHDDAFDEGDPPTPLGAWTDRRLDELAADVDAVIVGGGEIIHGRDELLAAHYHRSPEVMRTRAPSRFFIDGLGEREADVPVFWNAVGAPFAFDEARPGPAGASEAERVRVALGRRRYTTVRDRFTFARVQATGITPDEVVPDPAFVLDRLWSTEVLDRRLAFLRRMGWYPQDGPVVVVNGNRSLVPLAPELAHHVAKLCEQDPARQVVVLPTSRGHGDDEFADAFATGFERSLWRIPGDVHLVDIVAAIRSSALYLGSSLHGTITAFTYSVPHVILDLTGQSKLAAMAELLAPSASRVTAADELFDGAVDALERPPSQGERHRIQDQVDRHFDRLAEEILAAVADAREDPSNVGRDHLRIPALLGRIGQLVDEVEGLRRSGIVRATRDRRRLDRVVDHADSERHILEQRHQAEIAQRDTRLVTLANAAHDSQIALEALRLDHERLLAERDALDCHVEAIFATRTMRAAAIPRAVYQRWRSLPAGR